MGDSTAIDFKTLISQLERCVRELGIRALNTEVLDVQPVSGDGFRLELGTQDAHLGAYLPGRRRPGVETELGEWALSCEELKGHLVRLEGGLQFAPRFNRIEFVISRITPVGIGQAAARIAATRRRLADTKSQAVPLRFAPQRVGVIAAQSGAGLEDFEAILSRSQFAYQLTLDRVPLAGPQAAASCAAAIQRLEETEHVIVLVRGGGASASFSAFDDEALVRAISRCIVPIFCGAGHDRDRRLADEYASESLVSPSDAAHRLVAIWKEDEKHLQYVATDALDRIDHALDCMVASPTSTPSVPATPTPKRPKRTLVVAAALAAIFALLTQSWWAAVILLAVSFVLIADLRKAPNPQSPQQTAAPDTTAVNRDVRYDPPPFVCNPEHALKWLESLPHELDGAAENKLRAMRVDVDRVRQQSLAAFRRGALAVVASAK